MNCDTRDIISRRSRHRSPELLPPPSLSGARGFVFVGGATPLRRLTERPRGGFASLGRSDTARYFRAFTAAEITVIRDECRQASVVVARFAPPSVAPPFGHGVAVLKARSMGRGIGGLGSNVGPPRTIPEHYSRQPRRDPQCAGRSRCNHQVRRCPAQVCRGGLWLGGASRRTVAGGLGVTPT